jgi:hypothetical protein
MLAGACSGVRIAGWYLTRQIDGYLALDSDQKSWVRSRVDHHLEVTRGEISSDIIPLLRRVRGVVIRRPTEANLRALQAEVDVLVDRFVARLIPDVAALFASLRDDQIDRFQDKMRKGLGEAYEDLRLPAGERRQRADKKTIEAVEKWTGKLTKAQRARVIELARTVEDDRPATYRSHVARLNAFANLLRGDATAFDVAKTLQRLWDTRYEAIAPQSAREDRRAAQRRVLLALDEVVTMEQRRHMVGEIDGVIRKVKRFGVE